MVISVKRLISRKVKSDFSTVLMSIQISKKLIKMPNPQLNPKKAKEATKRTRKAVKMTTINPTDLKRKEKLKRKRMKYHSSESLMKVKAMKRLSNRCTFLKEVFYTKFVPFSPKRAISSS